MHDLSGAERCIMHESMRTDDGGKQHGWTRPERSRANLLSTTTELKYGRKKSNNSARERERHATNKCVLDTASIELQTRHVDSELLADDLMIVIVVSPFVWPTDAAGRFWRFGGAGGAGLR